MGFGLRTIPAVLVLWTGALRAESFDPWVEPARYELEYRVDLGAVDAPRGSSARVWIPMPAETPHQKVLDSRIEAPWSRRETQDRFGNRMLYLERDGAASSGEVRMRFVVERSPSSGVEPESVSTGTPLDPARYLKPSRLVPLDGVIAQIASDKSQGLETSSEKIRAFYDYVVQTMRYSKEGTGWGHGDAIWACTSKYGNCTDFHSLFIGMARSQGIPARFLIGFPIPAAAEEGEIPGYHCWAEVFDPSRGWIPLDASEAKKSGRVDDFFGRLPSDRVEFTVGRDLELEPSQRAEALNYFIYPYAEVDGSPRPDLPRTVRYRRLPASSARGARTPPG
jgi:transglutaminase-like putative cysteine protease